MTNQKIKLSQITPLILRMRSFFRKNFSFPIALLLNFLPLFFPLSSQISWFRQTIFDSVPQPFFANTRKNENPLFSLIFRAFFVLRMVLVAVIFLYYNQPKSKEVLHKHSRIYTGRDYFESKYNKSTFGR